jgi:hypothetical protein
MKSIRLILSLNIIIIGLILLLLPSCETNQESVKINSIKPNKPNKIQIKPEIEKPVNIPVFKPDSTIVPDTVETHDTQPQKKIETRIVRKVLNFHKKPLIT